MENNMMTFDAEIFTESTRSYIAIPFNVWDETGLRGSIPCSVAVGEVTFECKLIPKGQGSYYIPVSKTAMNSLNTDEVYSVTVTPIDSLTRINRNSPYSKENPVRKIDGIKYVAEQNGCCGHSCVAMLAGVPLEEVKALMGRESPSMSKITEALDYYGLSYAPKMVYIKGKDVVLPKCCIVNNSNHYLLWYDGSYCGTESVDNSKTVCYLEIYV